MRLYCKIVSFLSKKICFVLAFFLCAIVVYADKREIIFKQFSKEQGLPGDNVRSIFQDSYGFIWFGIESVGLCKYDGQRYYVYGIANGDSNTLSTSFINFMVEDENGDLWIATEQGLNIFNRDKGIFNSYFSPIIPDSRIATIYKDKSKGIWIGMKKGARRFIPINNHEIIAGEWFGFDDRKTKYIIDKNFVIEAIGDDIVNSIVEDNFGTYWLGTYSGLFIKCQQNNGILNCQKIKIDETKNYANQIYDIAQISENYLLLGNNVGVTLFDTKTNTSEDLNFDKIKGFDKANFDVTKILVDKNGIFWIGKNGIISGQVFNVKDINIIIPSAVRGLEGTHIRNIFEDNTGQIWVITKYAGIFKYDPRSQIFPHYTSNNNNLNFIICACESKSGIVFLGTKFGSLLEFNLNNSTITQKKIYLGDRYIFRIECLYEDANSNLWLGHKRGLIVLDRNKNVKKSYEAPKVYGMQINDSGTYWIFTEKGVYYLDKQTDKVKQFDLTKYGDLFNDNEIDVQNIYTDSNENIWFITYSNGVLRYNKNSNKLFWFKNEPDNIGSLSDNSTRSILEDSRGDIWIGTKFNGLNKYIKESNSFEHFTEADGLPSNAIYSILEDEFGNLWFATNNGVSKYNISKKQFLNFNQSHGLQGNVLGVRSSIRLKNNDLFFGGKNGFNMFSPGKVDIDTFSPPLVITNIQANDDVIAKDIFLNEEVCIPYKKSKLFTIEFAALDYRQPASINYAYQMEGVDNKWIYSDHRNFVTYSNLPHGKYIFRFKATNANGIWTKQFLTADITIETPFWLKWWAYIFYSILGIAIMYAIYYFATIRANYKYELSSKEQEMKRNEELNQMKLRFFTNISHEIRTPLTLILAPLQKLIKNLDLDENVKQKVELIDRSTKRLLKLTDQLLFFRKVQQENLKLELTNSDIVLFLSDIISPFYELAEMQKVHLEFISDYDKLQLWFDPDKIEKIFSNLLANAFKFTSTGDLITVKIHKAEKNIKLKKRFISGVDENTTRYLKISIKDTGIGMTKKQLEHIFIRFYQAEPFDTGVGIGLEFVKQLIDIHKGKIEVVSNTDQGTTFHIYLPLSKNVYKDEVFLDKEIDSKAYIPKNSLSLLYSMDTEVIGSDIIYEQNNDNRPKLLILEDNDELKMYLKQVFENVYNVFVANNGEDGLEIAKNEIPEIIITDVMMPKMDGIQFCKLVKSDVEISHIPVIMLTAKNIDKDQIEGLDSGADDYITKPFNEDVLVARIKNILVSRSKLRQRFSNSIYIDPSEITTNKVDEQFTAKLISIIDADISNPELSIQQIAGLLNMNRVSLFKKIKSIFGKSPSQFIGEYRIKNAVKLLLLNQHKINEIAYMVGFTSPAYFSKLFREVLGKTPSEFLKENTN